jgi:ribosomal protein L32
MKLTHSKTGSRRAHHRTATTSVTKSPAGARLRHHVDLETGMYRGKQILGTTKQPAKTEAKAKGTSGSKKADKAAK